MDEKIYYIILGPWTIPSILRKNDKILSQENCLYNYYQDNLKNGIWFRSENIQFDKIIKQLKEEELSLDQRIVLRGYIRTDEIGKKRTLNLFSVFIPMLVAAIIGFAAVVLSKENEMGIIYENIAATFITVIVLIAIYFSLLMHMSNREAKSSIVRTALDAYEELIKMKGNSLGCEGDSIKPSSNVEDDGTSLDIPKAAEVTEK